MMSPDALAMVAEDEAHRDAAEILEAPENVLRFLDANDIERCCCINYVSPDVMGFTRDVNDWIAGFTREHRDRLLPGGSVNPLPEPNAYRGELWQRAEIYRECEARRIPVMFHTGTSVFPRARNVFADPMPIDDVAVDFPELRILLAHSGRPLYGDTAFFLARRHRNVFLEISGIPPKALPKYVPRLAEMSAKVVWGTDWPSPGVNSPKKNVEDFLALGFSDDVNRRVLRENAEALFAA